MNPSYPSCPPYRGRYADVIPHLTIGHLGGAAELRAAGESVRPHLPIETRATEITLMAGPRPGGQSAAAVPSARWRTIAAFPLKP